MILLISSSKMMLQDPFSFPIRPPFKWVKSSFYSVKNGSKTGQVAAIFASISLGRNWKNSPLKDEKTAFSAFLPFQVTFHSMSFPPQI
jgi:hypothetical protein